MEPRMQWPGWETVRMIGRGSFGSVYEIRRDVFGRQEKAALKVISLPPDDSEIDAMYSSGYTRQDIITSFENDRDAIGTEYTLMKSMGDCPNVVHCDDIRYEQHPDGLGWDIFIKMELLTPLTKAVSADVPEETVIAVAKDICAALAECRAHDVVHRDIKPQNIFLSDRGICKLGDFGIARSLESSRQGTRAGTDNYMAPEIYRHSRDYDSRADIYSLGLVLYWLLNRRRLPFLPQPPQPLTVQLEKQARERRLSGESFPPPQTGGEELKGIVMKACAFDPNDRYSSAEEMLDALNAIGSRFMLDEETEREMKEEQARREKREQEQKQRAEAECRRRQQRVMLLGMLLVLLMLLIGLIASILSGDRDQHVHTWIPATCVSPATCADCGLTTGTPAGHRWQGGSCTDPAICADCGAEGAIADHIWKPATCVSLATCTECGLMSGSLADHVWQEATCTSLSTCVNCGLATGTFRDHQWQPATATAPQTCLQCGLTQGLPLGGSTPQSSDVGMIAAGGFFSLRLYPDGSVFGTGKSALSTKYENKGSRLDVDDWTDIVAVSALSHSVGLRSDGTVVACGVNGFGQCDLESWRNIKAICAGDYHTVGLRSDGTVVAAGKNEHGQCDLSRWRGIKAIAVSENETYGLREDGTVVSAGRYTYGSGWTDIVAIAAGSYDLFGLKSDGTVVFEGNIKKNFPENDISSWRNVKQLSVSSSHVAALLEDGTVVAFGRESAIDACQVSHWRDIVQVSAGINFTLGLKSDGTVVSVGDNRQGQCDLFW